MNKRKELWLNMKLNSLQKAKNNKNDEFYTRYEDIKKGVQCYVPHFHNKVVLCNCDNRFCKLEKL